MAIQGTIKTRTGLEADFDPYKMIAGEWAVSTDMKYVRMCFAPGVCYRMATYEAFEEDMIVIERILKETQDIQEAVEKIRIELNGKAELVAEDVQTAKGYMDQAEEYMNKAKEYADLSGALTGAQIAQKDLLGVVKGGDVEVDEDGSLRHFKRGSGNVFAIANTYDAPLSDIKQYGKSEQFSTSGKQLFDFDNCLQKQIGNWTATNVLTAPDVNDLSIRWDSVKGTATGYISIIAPFSFEAGKTIYFTRWTSNHRMIYGSDGMLIAHLTEKIYSYTPTENFNGYIGIGIDRNVSVDDVIVISYDPAFDTPEPYTGGIPSPNPEYPQPIVSVGEKLALGKNLWAYGDVAGTSATNVFEKEEFVLTAGKYTLSCKASANDGNYSTISFHDSSGANILSINLINNDVYNGASQTFTLSSDCASFTMYTRSDVVYSDIMLNSGSTALPWEPYTGGKKAAYEMGIGNVVSGANLLDMTGANSGKTNNGITAVVNEDGSYTVSGTATENIINIWFLGNYGDNMPVLFTLPAGTYYAKDIVLFNDKKYVSGATDAVFTITEETAITGVRCKQLSKGTTYSNLTFYPMINLGSEPLSWEPYTNQSHTLNRTLRAIPVTDASLATYTDADGQMWCADTIEEVDGKMCLVERIKRRIYGADGRSVKYANTNGVVYAIMQYNNPHDVYMETNGTMIAQGTTMLSNRGSYITWEQGDSGAIGVNYVNNAMRIYFGVTDEITSNDDVLALMTGWDEAGDSFYVDYILTTPIITELTDEEISAIVSLHSYYPVTTVMSDAWTEVECATSNVAAYVLSNKKEIDAVVAEIGTADISSIGDGTVKGAIKEHDSKFLPLTGGTLSGVLNVDQGFGIRTQIDAYEYTSALVRRREDNSYNAVMISEESWVKYPLLHRVNDASGNRTNYYILTEQNKPTGSYTGNGSATARTIDTGGLGSIAMITGMGCIIVTPGGGIRIANTSVYGIPPEQVKFNNGILTIASTDSVINTSGGTYYYQVL